MADITMCMNLKCPLKVICYRYLAVASTVQSYSDFKFNKEEVISCNYYYKADIKIEIK